MKPAPGKGPVFLPVEMFPRPVFQLESLRGIVISVFGLLLAVFRLETGG